MIKNACFYYVFKQGVKMKKILCFLTVLVLLFAMTGCKKTKEELKFYVVDGDAVSLSFADDVVLNTARREGRVAFTGEDIAGWLWEEHRVQLKEVAVLGGSNDGGSRLFQAEAEDCFVLAIGNRVIYTGSFAPASGTVRALRDPYIQDGAEDTFYLLCDQKYAEGQDPRADSYLYNYLAEQQLLVSEIQKQS